MKSSDSILKTNPDKVILALQTHHCVLKARKTYYFESAVSISTLEVLQTLGMKIHINRFSQIVKNAQDTFTAKSVQPTILITGVIGGNSIDVIFGKVQKDQETNRDEEVQYFENLLIKNYFGTQIIHKNIAKEQVNSEATS